MNNLASYQHQKNMTHKVNLHTKLLHNIGPSKQHCNGKIKQKNKTKQAKKKKNPDVFSKGSMQQLVKPKCS